jgi:elongation of very long chain fatty acids protein 4
MGQALDFLDTVFIVIRKRTRQLSFLHVFHHVSIFLMYWLNISIACACPPLSLAWSV